MIPAPAASVWNVNCPYGCWTVYVLFGVRPSTLFMRTRANVVPWPGMMVGPFPFGSHAASTARRMVIFEAPVGPALRVLLSARKSKISTGKFRSLIGPVVVRGFQHVPALPGSRGVAHWPPE